jgi:hypothetical protein
MATVQRSRGQICVALLPDTLTHAVHLDVLPRCFRRQDLRDVKSGGTD